MKTGVGLETVLGWFRTISAVPRASGRERAVSELIASWAVGAGLSVEADAAHNVLIRKPASPGCEGSPGLVLQAHLDMVAARAEGSAHDFDTDGIEVVRDGDWLRANGTTLGADNGVGVALALAILASDELRHPELEVLLTTGEEIGLVGAKALAVGRLRGRSLLNLDAETEGVFLVSGAGGSCAHVAVPMGDAAEPLACVTLHVQGLRGGHSGLDIDKGRPAALVELARYLSGRRGLRLASFEAPGAFNALSREALATFAGDAGEVEASVAAWRADLQAREPDARVTVTDAGPHPCWSPSASAALVSLVAGLPHGVHTRSDSLGIVESSLNVALAGVDGDTVTITTSVRSSDPDRADDLLGRVEQLAAEAGASVTHDGHYPAWPFRADGPLLADAVALHTEMFGAEPRVTGVHGGLECGVLAQVYPQIDMVSIGPNLHDTHTPAERAELASIERLIELTVALVQRRGEQAA